MVNIDIIQSINFFEGKDIKSSSSTNQKEQIFSKSDQWGGNIPAEHANIVKANLLNAGYTRRDNNPFHGETQFCCPQENINFKTFTIMQ